MKKAFIQLGTVFWVGSLIYILICIFHYFPEEVRNTGVPHTGEVIRAYKTDTAIVDGRRQGTHNIVVLLETGDEKTILVNDFGLFRVGEEIPLWEHKGAWFVDKYGNMEKPSPIIAILVFILSSAAVLYAKYGMQ